MKHNICPTCNKRGEYCSSFDAMYCLDCNTWLETKCTENPCAYCALRPEKPSSAYLRPPKTFSTIKNPLYSYNHFMALEVSGAIMQDDGIIEAVFIDGIDHPEICILGWSFNPIDIKFVNFIGLENLADKFPGKTIQLEWCENE